MAKEGKYGEQTKMVNYRIPLSLVTEINQMVKLRLLEFEKSIVIKNNPLEWATKYKEPLKSQKEYYIIPKNNEIDKINSDSNKNLNNIPVVDLKNLTKKANIEEEYDFVYVKSIPDQDEQIILDKKGLAFYSKYDLGVFYVKWEGKYMKFEIKSEFDRFAKEYLSLK